MYIVMMVEYYNFFLPMILIAWPLCLLEKITLIIIIIIIINLL
jgi:hypothetical protein